MRLICQIPQRGRRQIDFGCIKRKVRLKMALSWLPQPHAFKLRIIPNVDVGSWVIRFVKEQLKFLFKAFSKGLVKTLGDKLKW